MTLNVSGADFCAQQREKAAKNEPFDGVIHAWDTAYYRNQAPDGYFCVLKVV